MDTFADDLAIEDSLVAEQETGAGRKLRPRMPVKRDDVAGTCTFGDVTYAMDGLPPGIIRGLALRGLANLLYVSCDRDAMYAALLAGRLTSRTAKPREVSPWRRAIAAAMIEEAKKLGTPIAPEDALARAQAFPTAKLRECKKNLAVVKHYARITGASVSLLD